MRIAALFIVSILAVGSCTRPPQPETHQIQVGWRPVATFSGNSPTQTDSFNIESGEWRIKWTAASLHESGPETLQVTVHSAISGRPLMVVIEQKGPGHDISYVHEDPRLYHLVVDSSGVNWSLSIEEAVVGY